MPLRRGSRQAFEDLNMLSRFSIRKKLISLVSFLLASVIFMGVFGVIQMRAINVAAQDTQVHWLPSIRAVSEMRVQSARYRAILRDHLLIADEKAKLKIDKSLEDRVAAFEEAAKSYEPMIGSAEERELFRQVKQLWQEYLSKANEVIVSSRKGDNPQAIDINTNQATPPARAMDDTLGKIVAMNDEGANTSGQLAKSDYATAFLVVVGALAAMIVFGLGTASLIVGSVSGGISSITTSMRALVAGDLTATIPHRAEPTEIGLMADSLQIFKEALSAKQRADAAAAIEANAKLQRAQRVDDITNDFESLIGKVVGTVSAASSELETSAGTMTTTADRSLKLAAMVSSASEEAAANVQSVASATGQMASSVEEIGGQVQESARIASDAVQQAMRTNDRVAELSKAAARIGDVVELINNIAAQTNLLALNATIEAARAGDVGRGFAVVAAEVKTLAEQTAKATGEISQQISAIQAATDDSVLAIREIGSTIGRMSEIASAIASAVEEQGSSTREIARNVQQAAQGTLGVSSNIADLQRDAGEAGSLSTQVFAAARSLSSESDRLKLEVGSFLKAVRAA
jgi:methyl-accepting chemotaxis protein